MDAHAFECRSSRRLQVQVIDWVNGQIKTFEKPKDQFHPYILGDYDEEDKFYQQLVSAFCL